MENPTSKGRASRVSFPNSTLEVRSPLAAQMQFLIEEHRCQPGLAATVAALAFGEPHRA